MGTILMSIKPKYVDEIISGRKKYEYRKVKPKKSDIDKIIIYSSSPVMKVVAEVQVLDILVGSKEDLWNRTKLHSGISRAFFDEYYKDKEFGVAYKLGEVDVYEKPRYLSEFGVDKAPQSFIYFNN